MNHGNKILSRGAGLAGLLCMALLPAAVAQQTAALELSCRVADKMIRDTRFGWGRVPQTEVLGMQVLDFRFLHLQPQAYALRHARVTADTVLRFGIAAAGNVQVWVNRKPVWQQQQGAAARPEETSYNRFSFSQHFTAPLRKGDNEILVKYVYTSALPVVFLRGVTTAGDQDQAAVFTPGWLYQGPLSPAATIPDTLLPASYKAYALKAWEGVAQKIDADGTVHGICRGTEIGNDEQFYLDRKTINHDPRGLGAVIMAGIETAQLQ